MSRRLIILSTLALALTACQVAVTPPAGADRPGDGRATPRPGAKASATPRGAGPTATPVAAATATPVPVQLVAAPAGAGTLRGTVRLDAAYMVAAGAGNLIGNAGNTLAALDGAAAVAAAGGAFVRAGGGNAIADLRPSADGGSLIGLDGGSLVGLDGGSLVGNAGNTLIGNAGNTYRLAQAPTAALPVGTRLPASGMVVAAFSMTDGKPVPVGQGPSGEKVYGVYTDAAGNYALHPPAGLAGNLTIVALPPKARDPRLTLGVFAHPGRTAPRDVDEAADTTADFVRVCLAGQPDGLLGEGRETSIEKMILENGAALGLVQQDVTNAQRGIDRLEALAKRVGWFDRSEASRCHARAAIAQRLLADFDMDKTTMLGDPTRTAFAVLEQRSAEVQEEVRVLMAAPPPGKDFVSSLAPTSFAPGPCQPAGFRWELRRPADYMAFVVNVIMAPDPLDVDTIAPTIDALRTGIGLGPQGEAGSDMNAASLAMGLGIGRYLFDTRAADGSQPNVQKVEDVLERLFPAGTAAASGG